MKTFLLFSVSAAVSSMALNAATLYDFNNLTSDGSVYFSNGGVSGWSQNTANPPFGNGEVPLGYIDNANLGGSTSAAGYLGTLRGNLPVNAPTTLTGTLAAGGAISGSAFTMDLALLADSSFSTRDNFSIGITDGISTIATVSLSPGTLFSQWEVTLDVGGVQADTGFVISASAGYTLFIDFLDSSVRFGLSDTSGSRPSSYGTSAATVTGNFGDLLLTHSPNGAAGSSANGLVFDNIAINPVPEPSAALLLGVSALGLFRRNRRN